MMNLIIIDNEVINKYHAVGVNTFKNKLWYKIHLNFFHLDTHESLENCV